MSPRCDGWFDREKRWIVNDRRVVRAGGTGVSTRPFL
jgi:hypothetical protein